MNYEPYIQDAFMLFEDNDLQENEFVSTVSEHAKLMAGLHLVDNDVHHSAEPYTAHR
jgi:hypothetical protein